MATAVNQNQSAIEHLVGDFLAYLELERGLSRNSLGAYRSDLHQYGLFPAARGVDPLAAGHEDIADFLTDLREGNGGRAPVAPTTLSRKIACLRSFYGHLRREGTVEHDPTADVRGP